MKNSVLDLLGTSLIPELRADITAGSSGYEQLRLVMVAAVRALPDQLAGLVFLDLDLTIIAAYMIWS